MKSKGILLFKLGLFILIILLFTNCSEDDEIIPPAPIETIVLENTNGTVEFQIISNNIVITGNTINFTGVLSVLICDSDDIVELIEGTLEIVKDQAGNVLDITGLGNISIPNTGVFKKINEKFDWKKEVKARIEYKTGEEYDNGDFPLVSDRKYFHFEVFDEDNNNNNYFEWRSFANDKLFSFFDFYLDPCDPSLFANVGINLGSSSKKPDDDSMLTKLFNFILQKSDENNDNLEEQESPRQLNLSLGISNNGYIESQTYEFTVNEHFYDYYDEDIFKIFDSHIWIKPDGVEIPFPPPFPIFQASAEFYLYSPIQFVPSLDDRQEAVANWLDQDVDFKNLGIVANGSIDAGAGYIGALFSYLPTFEEIVELDLISDGLNLDVIGASLIANNFDNKKSFQIAAQMDYLDAKDFLGDDIIQYLHTPNQYDKNIFFFLDLPDNFAEDWSMYFEISNAINLINYINIPPILAQNYQLKIHKYGYDAVANLNTNLGPLIFTNKMLQSLDLREGKVNSSIKLTEDIEIFNHQFKDVDVEIKQETNLLNFDTTASFEGTSIYDGFFFNEEVHHSIVLKNEYVHINGSYESDISIPNTDITLSSREFGFNVSDEPGSVMEISGKVTIPGLMNPQGELIEVTLTGWNDGVNYSLIGSIEGNLNFNGSSINTSNGVLEISSENGALIYGDFVLGSGLGKVYLEGVLSNNELNLVGSLGATIKIDDHNFKVVNSYVEANSNTGVSIGASLNLYFFSSAVQLSGGLTQNGFRLTGNKALNLNINNNNNVSASTSIVANQNSVSITGNGNITILGASYGPTSLSFAPNWSTKKITICKPGSSTICLSF